MDLNITSKYIPKFKDHITNNLDPPYKNNCVYKKKVNEIDLIVVRPHRAGVILYTKINNIIYFGIGVDTITKEYTDFGGGISYKEKYDKNVITGALREFNEETLDIFGEVTYDDVSDSLAIYDYHNLIIFKYTNQNMQLIETSFRDTYNYYIKNNLDDPEVCDIKWLSMNEFKLQISTRNNMFFRIKNFLQKAGDFYWLL